MQKHIKNYFQYFNIFPGEFISCLLCNGKATEIHHIIPRSQIFGKDRDDIKNLAALCNACHYMIHNISSPKKYKTLLLEKQLLLIKKFKNAS